MVTKKLKPWIVIEANIFYENPLPICKDILKYLLDLLVLLVKTVLIKETSNYALTELTKRNSQRNMAIKNTYCNFNRL